MTLTFLLISRRQPTSTLFPYTTLFRSRHQHGHRVLHPLGQLGDAALPVGQPELVLLHGRADLVGEAGELGQGEVDVRLEDRKSTRLNSSHANISYAVLCLKKKKLLCDV